MYIYYWVNVNVNLSLISALLLFLNTHKSIMATTLKVFLTCLFIKWRNTGSLTNLPFILFKASK